MASREGFGKLTWYGMQWYFILKGSPFAWAWVWAPDARCLVKNICSLNLLPQVANVLVGTLDEGLEIFGAHAHLVCVAFRRFVRVQGRFRHTPEVAGDAEVCLDGLNRLPDFVGPKANLQGVGDSLGVGS